MTTDDLKEILKIVAPFATALFGAFLGFKTRLAKLERNLKGLRTRLEGQNALISSANSDIGDLEEAITSLRAELVRYENSHRQSSADFAKDTKLTRFIEDQEEAWQQIQRTIGRIEGWLEAEKAHQPRHPTTPPQTRTKPRLPSASK